MSFTLNGGSVIDLAEHLRSWSPARGRCLVIGEIAQAHEGSLGMAHAYIDAIASAGADGVKFQTHIADAESTPAEPWRVKFSPQDATRQDYWRRMEFSEAQWDGLRRHAAERGLLFLSSPFSMEAVELLSRIGVSAWKIASGEVNSVSMLERMLETDRPVLLSTGMSLWSDIDRAVNRVRSAGRTLAVLQCTTAYPCPPEMVGLNIVQEIWSRYQCPPGLSDHSGTIFPSLAAAVLGCALVEVHVTFSRQMFGPDVRASLEMHELRQLTEGIRFIDRMKASKVDKDKLASELTPLYRLFSKSIVAATDLPAGTRLERRHLSFKKPGTGLPEDRLSEVLGRRLVTGLKRDEQVLPEHLGNEETAVEMVIRQ